MISSFSIFFLFALLSILLHRTKWLKPFALMGIVLSSYCTFNNIPIGLSGFFESENIKLFELILEIVLFAIILHEDEDITITQILFIGASSILLLQSDTIVSFVISFESLSLISVVLVSSIKTKEQAQGAIKMFIAGGISTAILFLGLVFYVMGGGDLLQPIITKANNIEQVGIYIMIIGLFYKLTIVPFHGWAADTYALVRDTHAAILSAVSKTVVVLAVFHIFSPFLLQNIDFSVPVLVTFAIVTMTLGNFMALFSKNLARILSYSSIAHAGYILLGFASIKSEFANDGILYISIAYIFMQSAGFLTLDILRKNYNISTLKELSGFSKQNPLVAFFFTVQLLSLAGIPLLAGFLGKAVVFYAGVDAGLWWVVLIALLNSALSVGYYAWIIKSIYFDTLAKKEIIKPIYLAIVAQIILFAGTVYFGIFAKTVFNIQ